MSLKSDSDIKYNLFAKQQKARQLENSSVNQGVMACSPNIMIILWIILVQQGTYLVRYYGALLHAHSAVDDYTEILQKYALRFYSKFAMQITLG